MSLTRRSFMTLVGSTGLASSLRGGNTPAPEVEASVSPNEWNQKYVQTGYYPPVTYLLIDDLFVARMEGVRRVMGRPERVLEPVLKTDKPWEGKYVFVHNAFLYDPEEKVFKIWYHCHDPGFRQRHPELRWDYEKAYAISANCRTWEKPELGVVEWSGSRRNNLVSLPQPTGGDGPLANLFKDPRDPNPKRRYKAMGMERHLLRPGERPITWPGIEKHYPQGNPLGSGLYLYDSADGFTWTQRPRLQMSQALVMDGTIVHGFDEGYNAWIFWFRTRSNPKYRTIGVSFVRDLETIPYPQAIFVPDETDPPGVQFDRFASIKVPGGYVGLLVNMHTAPEEGYKMEPQLAFSRDARVWTRPGGREAFLPCSEKGCWDDMYVIPANPVQVGDDIYILYHGGNAGNGDYAVVEDNGVKRMVAVAWGDKLPDGRVNLPGIGLAKLERDRWAAIEPVSQVGVLQTRPMYWANRTLQVNADARRGSLRTELLDHYGKPIPGFTLADSDRFSGNSFSQTMSWKGVRELPVERVGHAYAEGNQDGSGRLMSIRFYLDAVRLFSFCC